MSKVRVDGEYAIYPYSLYSLRSDFPDTSFPAIIDETMDLSSFGVFDVVPTVRPDHNPFTHSLSVAAEKIEDVWTEVWTLVPYDETTAENLLNQKKAQMWEAIKVIRDRQEVEGGFFVYNKWFHSETSSRIKYIALTKLGESYPPHVWWKTMDGSFIDVTEEMANGILQAAAMSDLQLFAYAEGLKAQVYASDRPDLIDITQGWPATFASP